ncbi:unnamed protein product, partial [Porites evermanni]
SIAVNIALDHITNELAVECQSQGCDWKGKYARAQAHQKHCPKLLVKCSNDRCAFRESREKMPQHEKSCSKREIPCKGCGDLIVWDSSQEHAQFQCTNATRPCPLIIFPRSHVNLHQHLCPETVTECRVMGCGTLVKRKKLNTHLMEAAAEHFALQSNEIIKLKQSIFNKTSNPVAVKVNRIDSFCWSITNFPRNLQVQGAGIHGGHKWRALFTIDQELFLQLVEAAHPITTEIRIVMSAGEETETTFRSDTVILKEGEMWGRRMIDINRYVDGDGKVEIKFIIYHLNLKM